jgi:hypothetical protein
MVELAEQLVEEVPDRGSVPIATVSAAPIVIAPSISSVNPAGSSVMRFLTTSWPSASITARS